MTGYKLPYQEEFGQIDNYKIPPIPTKKTDSRANKFISEHGDIAVELDALNPKVLQGLIQEAILFHLDKEAYDKTIEQQGQDVQQIQEFIDSYEGGVQ